MDLPALEIAPGEPVRLAAARLEEECRRLGIPLIGFEDFNKDRPTSRFSNFYQARIGDRETVLALIGGEWTEEVLAHVLDVLLKIRLDPDPPGADPRFRIISSHPPPGILDTFFGDHRISPLECRAAGLALFGNELQPADCTRLAAAGLSFLATLGSRTSFGEPAGIDVLQGFVAREVRALGLPMDKAPLNLLICLGCLYGEMIRSRLSWETEWASVKELLPWPCLVVWPRPSGSREARPRIPPLGFSPIALVIQLSQGGEAELLTKNAAALLERCRREFEAAKAPGEPGAAPSSSSTPSPGDR